MINIPVFTVSQLRYDEENIPDDEITSYAPYYVYQVLPNGQYQYLAWADNESSAEQEAMTRLNRWYQSVNPEDLEVDDGL